MRREMLVAAFHLSRGPSRARAVVIEQLHQVQIINDSVAAQIPWAFSPGLGAVAPVLHQDRLIEIIDHAVILEISGAVFHGLGALSPGAEKGEQIGGVRIAVAIDIAIRRAPRAQEEQQIGGIDIAIPVEVGRAFRGLELVSAHIHYGRLAVARVFGVRVIDEARVAIQVGRDAVRHGGVVGCVNARRAGT